jgi:hypothetical protein
MKFKGSIFRNGEVVDVWLDENDRTYCLTSPRGLGSYVLKSELPLEAIEASFDRLRAHQPFRGREARLRERLPHDSKWALRGLRFLLRPRDRLAMLRLIEEYGTSTLRLHRVLADQSRVYDFTDVNQLRNRVAALLVSHLSRGGWARCLIPGAAWTLGRDGVFWVEGRGSERRNPPP